MRCATGSLAAAVAASMLLAAETADAVSLRPNKTTDESVCDLTHDTNAYLSSKVLVPAAADQKDQVEALYRLAADELPRRADLVAPRIGERERGRTVADRSREQRVLGRIR